MIAVLLALHVAAAAIIFVAGHRMKRSVFAVAIAPLLVSVIAVATQLPTVLDGDAPSVRTTWVRDLALSISFRLDGFATLMALLVAGVGAIVLAYSWGYFRDDLSGQRVVRFAGLFVLFAGAMLGLVVADDVWTLYLFWELTSVLSFLLIGLDDAAAAVREAALRALLITGAGGLAMLGGLICLVSASGTSDLRGLLAASPTSLTAQTGLLLLLVGAFSKSAQVPFHIWLPGAMAAPAPVSAFLHSATMVKAGVVVVARFAPAFAEIGWWRPLLVVVGGVTMLTAGVAALRRNDAKQALAFGTVSQLGLLVTLFGLGEPEVTAAAVAVLVAHVLFKSGLFLAVGAVEHATGSRALDRLSGVGRRLPLLAVAAGVCTMSMIGLPLTLGFVAKESALAALIDGGGTWVAVALVVVVIGSVLTTAYSIRTWWGMFATKRNTTDVATVHHPPGPSLTVPVVIMAALSLAAGLASSTVADRLSVAAESLDQASRVHLALLPGLHLPLLLSAVIIAAGAALAGGRRGGVRRGARATVGERLYGRTYKGLLEGARRITSITQSGSLPVYVAVVFAVVVAVLGAAIGRGASNDWGDPILADSLLQATVALLAAVIAIAVVMARRRFVSVLLLGGVGQGLTVLFLMYGAPDLALTQFMIETLMIVAFMLVLRHLPRDFEPPPTWAPKAIRIAISVSVGVVVSLFALQAGGGDRRTDVTDTIEQLSLPAAGGKNVVNVTIVDFRGIDTMFEITVFGIAALGVANLVTASRRSVGHAGLTRFAKIGAESMIFVQVSRMIFHVTLLVSLYVALRGHNAPGGGFAGGLIAGAAFVFRLLAGGPPEGRGAPRLSPVVPIACGILMAAGSGVGALVAGNEFLETSTYHVSVPLIGDVKLVSAGIFDLGVYFLVIGVVILVLSHLASRTHLGGVVRNGTAS